MHEGTPKVENSSEISAIIEGIDFVFEQHPELKEIGTKEQYSEYLGTVFPESMAKGILYHGGEVKEFEEREEGSYFTKDKEYAKNHGDTILPVLINIRKGARIPIVSKTTIAVDFKEELKGFDGVIGEEAFGIVKKNGKSFIAKGEVYVVFKPEQVYILGSKSDIEKFKEFVG
jgi:hypothetical protein